MAKSKAGTSKNPLDSILGRLRPQWRAARLDESNANDVRGFIWTPYLAMDYVVGNWGQYRGGVPMGSAVEAYGPNSAGKTTWSKHLMAAIQRGHYTSITHDPLTMARVPDKGEQRQGWVILADLEHTWDKEHAQKIGVIPGRTVVLFGASRTKAFVDLGLKPTAKGAAKGVKITPRVKISELFEATRETLDAIYAEDPEAPVLVVWDTMDMTVADENDTTLGAKGKAWKYYLTQLVTDFAQGPQNATLVGLNQVIANMTGGGPFAKKTVPTTPSSMKHLAITRYEFAKTMDLKFSDEVIGTGSKLRVEKSKVGGYRHVYEAAITADGYLPYYSLAKALVLDSEGKKCIKTGNGKFELTNPVTGEVFLPPSSWIALDAKIRSDPLKVEAFSQMARHLVRAKHIRFQAKMKEAHQDDDKRSP